MHLISSHSLSFITYPERLKFHYRTFANFNPNKNRGHLYAEAARSSTSFLPFCSALEFFFVSFDLITSAGAEVDHAGTAGEVVLLVELDAVIDAGAEIGAKGVTDARTYPKQKV